MKTDDMESLRFAPKSLQSFILHVFVCYLTISYGTAGSAPSGTRRRGG